MHRLRRKLKEFVWVALVACVALAVVPTISRAIHAGLVHGSAGSDHASMFAMSGHAHHHDHAPAPNPAPPSGSHTHSLDQCEMCLVAAGAFALAPAAPSIVAAAGFDGSEDRWVALPPRLRDDWSPAAPRGPPNPV